MAITTYAELKTAVANWLDRDDLTARIPEFVALAEDRIYQDPRIRVRAMETRDTAFSIAAQQVSLPAGFVGMKRVTITSGSPNINLDFKSPYSFWAEYDSSRTGTPRAFTFEGEYVYFSPEPDATYTATIVHYKRLTAFSGDSDTNWFLTNARGLYLYGTLLEAAMFLEDDALTLKYSMLFDDQADRLKEADNLDRFSGGPLVPTTRVYGP